MINKQKFVVVFCFLFLLSTVVFSVKACVEDFESSGGIRGVIIDAGREIKDIAKEIQKEE